MRQFFRHPADIPIEVSADKTSMHATSHAHNLSYGGLAFDCEHGMEQGAVVDVRIPFVRPTFETKARVVWCRKAEKNFELGVEFLEPGDIFRARMVEQVCHIENYKRQVLKLEQRELTSEQAAIEWIDRFASTFPGADSDMH